MKQTRHLTVAKTLGVAALVCGALAAHAQTCVTQARMDATMRAALHDASMTIATAVKAGDTAAVKAASAPELAGNFTQTEQLIRTTSEKLMGDTLTVSHVYGLDAAARKAGDQTNADFACMLKDSGGSETDFSIGGLPPGNFGFAMVEANGGGRSWLLAMLLQQQSGTWKMAGFYPRARTAAGHDGLWFWKSAREEAAAKESLLSWLSYDEAAALLQPAPFVTSSNLDKLRTEQRQAGPPELVNGASSDTPLTVPGANGESYKFNSLATEPSDDSKTLHLIVHLSENPSATPDAIRAHSDAAVRALVKAHPALKSAYGTYFVFVDGPQGNPPVVTLTASQLQ